MVGTFSPVASLVTSVKTELATLLSATDETLSLDAASASLTTVMALLTAELAASWELVLSCSEDVLLDDFLLAELLVTGVSSDENKFEART